MNTDLEEDGTDLNHEILGKRESEEGDSRLHEKDPFKNLCVLAAGWLL